MAINNFNRFEERKLKGLLIMTKKDKDVLQNQILTLVAENEALIEIKKHYEKIIKCLGVKINNLHDQYTALHDFFDEEDE